VCVCVLKKKKREKKFKRHILASEQIVAYNCTGLREKKCKRHILASEQIVTYANQYKGYMVNDQGVRTSAAHTRLSKKGAAARSNSARATALGEHHSHICISAIFQRGASIKWKGEIVRMYHYCYDPERSGLAGQKPQQVKGLGLRVCKKCHRTAKKCKEASCLAPACSNNSLILCKHLH